MTVKYLLYRLFPMQRAIELILELNKTHRQLLFGAWSEFGRRRRCNCLTLGKSYCLDKIGPKARVEIGPSYETSIVHKPRESHIIVHLWL
jgi:hypothetical protein